MNKKRARGVEEINEEPTPLPEANKYIDNPTEETKEEFGWVAVRSEVGGR